MNTNLLWRDILNEILSNKKIMLYSNLIKSSLEEHKSYTYTITIDNVSPFTCTILSKPDNIKILKEVFKNRLDKDINLNIYDKTGQKFIYEDNVLPFKIQY